MNLPKCRLALCASLLMPAAAFAHTGSGAASFAQGIAHPWGGLDHFLAMIAVGVLASRMQGWTRFVLPAAFLIAMTMGGTLGAVGISLPFVEILIACSLVAFGFSIALDKQRPLGATALVVAAFGLFHGHAHGTELLQGSLVTYSVGFIASSAALHAAGASVALRLRAQAQDLVRCGGGAIAATGVALLAMAS